MNEPHLLFVDRIAVSDGKYFADGQCFASCLGLDERGCVENDPAGGWRRGEVWRGFVLENAAPITFREIVYEGTGLHLVPSELSTREPCFGELDLNDSTSVVIAQNGTYLAIDEMPHGLEAPFFISRVAPSRPIRTVVSVDFSNSDIYAFPDVVEYNHRLRSNVLDKWDAMFTPPENPGRLRFPERLWFACALLSGQREAAGVFSIVEWRAEECAAVKIACSDDSVPLSVGCRLVRRFRSKTGLIETELGRVTGVLE